TYLLLLRRRRRGGRPALALLPCLATTGALSGHLFQPRHQGVVHIGERLRDVVRMLADLVCDLHDAFEIHAVRELRAELTDEALEIVREALCVLDRSHRFPFPLSFSSLQKVSQERHFHSYRRFPSGPRLRFRSSSSSPNAALSSSIVSSSRSISPSVSVPCSMRRSACRSIS